MTSLFKQFNNVITYFSSINPLIDLLWFTHV